MRNAICQNCHWYYATGMNLGGSCRRHSPSLLLLGLDDFETHWPQVSANEWCGDFEPSPQREQVPVFIEGKVR